MMFKERNVIWGLINCNCYSNNGISKKDQLCEQKKQDGVMNKKTGKKYVIMSKGKRNKNAKMTFHLVSEIKNYKEIC